MSDEAVYRTAPATPGLLIIVYMGDALIYALATVLYTALHCSSALYYCTRFISFTFTPLVNYISCNLWEKTVI